MPYLGYRDLLIEGNDRYASDARVHRFKYPLCGLRMAAGARPSSHDIMRLSTGYKRQQNGDEKMPQNHPICSSCNISSETVKHARRSKLDLCDCCRSWVRMSLRRTRKIPAWVRPDPNISAEELAELREVFQNLSRRQTHNQMRQHYIFHMGFPYLGPISEKAWSAFLTPLGLFEIEIDTPLPNIPHNVIEAKISRLERAGTVQLPTQPALRKHIAHLLRGDFGLENKRLFITAVFIWLVAEDEYIARVPEAWANSFTFLREVVNELGDRASFVDGIIRVIGSSGNTYCIAPTPQSPYYFVSRVVNEDQRAPICIDPVGASKVVFGDVLVTLVLSLYDDQISARRINTLSHHVFGRPNHPRRRNTNIDHLWRRALGNAPRPPLTFQHEDPTAAPNQELPIVWRRLLDRFQTNLADWTLEEDGE